MLEYKEDVPIFPTTSGGPVRHRGISFVRLALMPILALFVISGNVASAQQQIGPNEHFIGLVNGSNDNPVVYTVCPGPEQAGRKGPVAGGQTMSVAEVAHGRGFTGPLTQIYSWFVPTGKKAPIALTFTTYGTPQLIPTSVRVPCDGKGKVEFSPCPYLAPCVYGWSADVVRVTFVDIAA
jgi:hypothetical protein